MSDIPADLYYTEEHEYLKATDEDGVYAVGVTDYAQGELGDVVFVELPDGGAQFGKMDVFGTIEAVKAESERPASMIAVISTPNSRKTEMPISSTLKMAKPRSASRLAPI